MELSICFDTGHVLSGFSGAIGFFEALDCCLPYLAEVHLHDSPDLVRAGILEYGRDHQPLGDGELELELFFEKLDKAGFQGPVIFELQMSAALSSMRVIRSVRPDVFSNQVS